MAKKIEPKVKVIPVVDHYKCQFCEPLKMPKHIYCNHMYIRMIMRMISVSVFILKTRFLVNIINNGVDNFVHKFMLIYIVS